MSVDSEALAAEYVLGTLDAGERAQAQGLLALDEAFAAKVKVWERRLGELHLMVEPVEPDSRIWQRIRAKLPEAVTVAELESAAPEPEPPAPTEPPAAPPEPTLPTAASFEAVLAAVAEPLPPSGEPVTPSVPEPARPTAEAAPRTPVAPALSPDTAPPSPQVPAAAEPDLRGSPLAEQTDKTAAMRRRLRRWRAFAALMTLVVLAIAGLVGAWKFAPDQVPPMLQPAELMQLVGVSIATQPVPPAPPRPPVPPGSEYDE
jgi:hypothetical protein